MYILLLLSLFFVGNDIESIENATYAIDSIPSYINVNDTILVDTISNDTIYKIVEEQPIFGDCEATALDSKKRCSNQKLMLYILKMLKTPKDLEVGQLQSHKIVVRFVIDKSGNVRDLSILKSIHPDFDKMFLEIINQMPKWQAAKVNNKSVNTEMIFPMLIHFE